MFPVIGAVLAVIGVGAVFFVMRRRAVQTRSMYSSRRNQIERKVKAARQRTLAPQGRTPGTSAGAQLTDVAMAPPPSPAGSIYDAPGAGAPPPQSWDASAAPAPMAFPLGAEASAPAPPATPVEPAAPAGPGPAWTPGPPEQTWSPSEAPASSAAPPAMPAAPPPPSYSPSEAAAPSAEGDAGAAWSIVGETKDDATEAPAARGRGKRAASSQWSLASGETPEEDDLDQVKGPNVALGVAQYAVFVVGLIMVLIGVLVMVANSKVT